MPLTDTQIRKAKSREKPYKLTDERGLYLEVSPSGGKWWRFKYRFHDKEKRLSLGVYPDIDLKTARERRDEARRLVANKIDPSEKRKAEKATRLEEAANTFESIAREWHANRQNALEQSTLDGIIMRMEKHLFPWIGSKPIARIEAPDLLEVLRRAESLELGETPRRLRQYCGQIFRYAIYTGRARRDPAGDLRGALRPHKPKHHAAVVEPKAVGELLRAIDGCTGEPVTHAALRLAPLVFVRPGELRRAEWTEIDLDRAEWRIPAVRMKMREAHFVPLSRQVVDILRELQRITANGSTYSPVFVPNRAA